MECLKYYMENQFFPWGIIEPQSKFSIRGIDIMWKAFGDINPLGKCKISNMLQETKLLESKKTR